MPGPSKILGTARELALRGRQAGQASRQETTGDLSRALKNSSVAHPHVEGKSFIPLDSLERLITEQSVMKDLQRLRMDDRLCKEIAKFVCPKYQTGSKEGGLDTSGRKLFAILVLIDESQAIDRFRREGLSDRDLPFRIDRAGGKPQLLRNGVSKISIQAFNGWKVADIENFEIFQWCFLSPFLSTHGHYDLETKVLLPFVPSGDRNDAGSRSGGYGSVFKVRIHQAHHNFNSGKGENPHYAVKRLMSRDEAAFKREVDTLQRLSHKPHSNLIELLATYKHSNSYHLIFPWADGNLRQLWQSVPRPKLNRHLALWMATQCHAICAGLSIIHNYQSSSDLQSGSKGGASSTRTKLYGRHGDLKPENVLWFRDQQSREGINGTLKISDFGCAEFNVNESRSNRYIPPMPTYRPPENDMPGEDISQSFDIWTLGCLYLEFASWVLKGYTAACDTFADVRLGDGSEQEVSEEDTFFHIEGRTAYLKVSVVKWIDFLHADANCTAYLHELLDFTLAFLLNPHPRERATCNQVVQQLSSMQEKYQKSEAYILSGFPRTTRSTAPLPYHGKGQRRS